MDKITTGFITVPKGGEKEAKTLLIEHFKKLCYEQFGKNANVSIKLIPIQDIVKNEAERLSFTHGYSARLRA